MSRLLARCALFLMALSSVLQAAPQHAITLYGEPAKYPADFIAWMNPSPNMA